MATRTEINIHSPAAKILHHLHLISMILLVVSGFYIHRPWTAGMMGTMRYLHFVSMYVLAFVWIVRFYYALFGAQRDISRFLPEKENKGKLFRTIKYYLFVEKYHPETAAYNPLQKATYVFWFFLLIIQGFTGFALYWPNSSVFGWVNSLLGGLVIVRMTHFLIMWIFIVTAAIHFYLTLAENVAALGEMFSSGRR